MKKKTINAVLCKKFDDFLSSITDEKVKSLAETNSIITGGSIASMLLKEKVNDYDIYFTNKETVKAVAEYYVAKFKKENTHTHKDGNKLLIEVVDGVQSNVIGSVEGRVLIHIKSAGIASETETNDYQYFESQSEETTDNWVNQVTENISEPEEDDEETNFIGIEKEEEGER